MVNKNIILLINSTLNNLGEAENRVASYIKGHPEEVINLPINILAKKAETSVSTIIRLCTKIGIDGYSNLKIELAKDLAVAHQDNPKIESSDDFNSLFNKADKMLSNTITNSFKMLEKEKVRKVISTINNASSVLVIGTGGSAIVANLFSYRLLKLDVNAQFSNDMGLIPLLIGKMKENDVIFAISHSGSNTAINNNVKIANKQGCTTIALTNYKNSPLAKNVDFKILTAVSDELIGGEKGAKRIVQASVVELLCILITLENKS